MLVLGLIFVFSNQVFHYFLEIQLFGFYLVYSECGAYLTVNQNLVYSYPKMFVLFFVLFVRFLQS